MGTRMIYESHDHDMPHGKTQDTSNIFTELGIGESDTKTLEDLSDKITQGLLEESSGGRGGEKGPKPSETLKDITKGLKPKEDKRSEGGEDSNENGDDGDNEGEGEGGEGFVSRSGSDFATTHFDLLLSSDCVQGREHGHINRGHLQSAAS